jgi:hypothetical protein
MQSAPNNLSICKGDNENVLFGRNNLVLEPSAEVTFLPTTAKALLTVSHPVVLSVNYESLYKCVHYQAHRRGVIFLLWSSSRIHQPHTHIYLQIIGKAKMFNCM